MSHLLSVVIPAFNSDEYLAEAISSVMAQQISGLQLIVVDDGSACPAAPTVHSLCPSATVLRQSNRGPAAARNRGIEIAQGQFVGFLDSDDIWAPGAVSAMLRGFHDAPSVQVVQGYLRDYVGSSPPGHPKCAAPYRERGPARCSVHFGTWLARRELFRDLGAFNEDLRTAEDLEFHIRLRDSRIPRLVIPNLLLLYRRHDRPHGPGARQPVCRTPPLRLLAASHRRRATQALQPERTLHSVAPANLVRPAITAAVVVKNGAHHIEQALQSIEQQTWPAVEILCILGESADATASLLRHCPGIRVLEQARPGLAAARNQAISEAIGSHVAFLDHDDMWLPNKLQLQIDALELLEGPGISITGIELFNERGSAIESRSPPRLTSIRLGTTPSALLADKRVFDQIGGFDERMSYGSDGDWFARVLDSAVPISVVSRTVTLKRLRQGSLSARPDANRREALAIIANRRRRAHVA